MRYTIKEGNYANMGVEKRENNYIFTFEGEKEDKCCIVIINKDTKAEEKIEIPSNFCLGSLRSVEISGIETDDFLYYYEINCTKVVDPYSRAIFGREKWNDETREERDYEVSGRVNDLDFDWSDDEAPEIPKQDMIMYKLHIRGFSKGNVANKKVAGTFEGVKNRIDYLKSLGVTTVEFMPVYEFEEMELPVSVEVPDYVKWESEDDDVILPPDENPISKKVNYWGYGTGNYFAVKSSYAFCPEKASWEFKNLVKTFHSNGMECILEMYFPNDTNHNMILDALRFWVREYHVDGFHLLGENLPITAIVQDVLLSRTKIFYPEFNTNVVPTGRNYKTLFVYKDEYMYPSRKILNHMNGDMKSFLDQQRKQGSDLGYVNYITSNNGFTMADLFMYNYKHNEANGEENADGNQWNYSNNYGEEGPSRKKFVREVRNLKWRNAMLMMFLAQGVPMIWSGDEIKNSQHGNNNAYCQDNEIGWVDWKNEKNHKSDLEFLKKLIEFRKAHPIISQGEPFHFCDYKSFGYPDLSFHGENAWISGSELNKQCVGMMYCGEYSPEKENNEYVYIAYNFYSYREKLALPGIGKKKKWYLVADSSKKKDSFNDEPVLYDSQDYVIMNPQAICILVGK